MVMDFSKDFADGYTPGNIVDNLGQKLVLIMKATTRGNVKGVSLAMLRAGTLHKNPKKQEQVAALTGETNMMIHFTKNELLDWLDHNAPSRSVQRALRSGYPITILGGFNPLPNSNSPGWIILIENKSQEYYVAVAVDMFRGPRSYLIDYIDWASYTGGTHPLYKGDMPGHAEEHKQLGTVERVNQHE